MRIRPFLQKYLRSYPEWCFKPPRVSRSRELTRFGSDYGGYFLDTSLLPREPIIYSAGIGRDISFDLTLIERYRCTVHAFDPTPKVQAWLAGQELPPEFRFHAVGLANFDGNADFYQPVQADFISHSMVEGREYSSDSIPVCVMKLASLMKQLGHSRIDVLKMDVEGAEYGVMADLMRDRIEVDQIVVEFHHRLSSIGVRSTRRVLGDLADYGLEVCYVSPRADVFTLIRRAVPDESVPKKSDLDRSAPGRPLAE